MLRPAARTSEPNPGYHRPAMALHVRGGVETRRLVTLACPWRVRFVRAHCAGYGRRADRGALTKTQVKPCL